MCLGFSSPRMPSTVGATSLQGSGRLQSNGIITHVDERDRIGRVVRMRATGFRIDHHLGIPVIGSDQPTTAGTFQGRIDFAEASIDSFACSDCRLQFARMGHHVRIREVHHNDIEIRAFDCCHNLFR